MYLCSHKIPTNEVYQLYGKDSFSFLDKSIFEGVILFSTVSGSFRWIKVYSDGPIFKGKLISPADSSAYDSLLYVSVSNRVSTKCDVDSLDASYCIGYIDSGGGGSYNPFPEPEPDNYPYYPNDGEGSWWGEWRELDDEWCIGGDNCGGGGGNNEELDPAIVTDTVKTRIDTMTLEPIVPNDCKVVIYVSGNGFTYGSGSYKKGYFLYCSAIPDTGWYFDRWTGDFENKGPNFTFKIEGDYYSTVYFRDIVGDSGQAARPCFDQKRNLSNPLKQMKIARTSSGRLIGGTYGWTRFRDGKKRFHSGLDLYADPGTEIYAMIDGVIGPTYVVEQPDIDKDGNFPIEYGRYRDRDGAGNRIYLLGDVDGKSVEIGYWHLRSGTPVAENPRTGKPYAPGDIVYRGELIAYSGRTGNAYNVPEPHLHLSFKVKNAKGLYEYKNPERLINGEVEWNNGNILSEWIKDIICDSDLWDPDYGI